MFRLVVLAKMLSRAVEASFHRGDTGIESLGDFRMTATFLHQGQQGPILRPQLRQRMAQCIEFLRIDGVRRFRDVFMLFAKREKYPAQFLTPELIDASIARESEQPRLELRRRLQTVDGANHFYEHLLRQIFNVITSAGHGVNEASNPMLIADNELSLSGFVALLSAPYQVGQRSR
jgi:hypothetical protein